MKNKTDWFEAGLLILAHSGPDNLTIDNLCNALKITKGSFYHHFKNISVYVEELMIYWRDNTTKAAIKNLNSINASQDTLRKLTLKVVDFVPVQAESSIRIWAGYNATVEKYLSEVDVLRTDFVTKLYREMSFSKTKAQSLAKIKYSLYLGLHMLYPKINDAEFVTLANLFDDLVNKMELK